MRQSVIASASSLGGLSVPDPVDSSKGISSSQVVPGFHCDAGNAMDMQASARTTTVISGIKLVVSWSG